MALTGPPLAALDPTPRRRVRTRWIRRPAWDLAMALAWVPFAALALVWNDDPSRLRWLVGATLIFSLSHQPLTIPLVYADPQVRRSRPVLFRITPAVFLVAVVIGLQLDPVVIAVVAAVWNAAHTLQQRYGIVRIYGRKVGQADGTTERRLLWALLLAALVWAAADSSTPGRIAAAGFDRQNRRGLDLLTDAAPIAGGLVPVTLVVVAALVVVWVRQERARGELNPAKWAYLTSTVALIAVTMVSPLAGFVGFVGAHAAEYFLIVHNHLGERYVDPHADGGAPLGRAVRTRSGPAGFLVLYALVVGAMIWAVAVIGSYELYALVFLTLGALHLFYDGLIWKLRRPEVAKGFGIAVAD